MARAHTGKLFQQVRQLVAAHRAETLPDQHLLERFVTHRDETAFAVLVKRHGGLVLRVGQGVLQNRQDAEDVFQAAFLVLARKAATIRKRQSVGSWLYGVAYRLALKAQGRARKRRQRAHLEPPRSPPTNPLDELTWGELRAILHEEMHRLPDHYRAALLLCYWEGKTHEEAAQELGWKKGTLKDRLERARKLLRGRLSRRGIALAAVLTPTMLTQTTAAAVPALLTVATVKAATAFAVDRAAAAGGASARAVALAEGMVRGMALFRSKLAALLVLALGVVVAGASLVAQRARTGHQGEAQPEKGPKPATRTVKSSKPDSIRPTRTDRYGDPLPPGAVARLGTVRFRHDGWVGPFALSPDGRVLASTRGPTIYLWETATGKGRRRFAAHDDAVHCLAFSADGTLLASGGNDNTVRLWEAATGKAIRPFKGHTGAAHKDNGGVHAVAFTPDGKNLVSRGGDRTIRLWEVATGKELRQFPGHQEIVHSITLSPDGKVLAGLMGPSGQPGAVRLWTTATGQKLWQFPHAGEVSRIAFSADGRTLAVAGGGSNQPVEFRLWDVPTGKLLRSWQGHQGWVFALAFAPDGKTLASAGYDKTIRLWAPATGKELRLIGRQRTPIYQIAFCRQGKALIARGADHTLHFWDPVTAQELRPFEGHQDWVGSVAYSPDGKFLATASGDATVRLWDLATRQQRRRLQGHTGSLSAVVVTADGKTVVSASPDGTVRLWEAATGKERRRFKIQGRGNSCMAFAVGGKVLAVWDEDAKTLRLWDPATGKALRHWQFSPGWIQSLAFSPDGSTLAAGSGTDLFVHLWDVATGKEVRQFGPHTGGLTSVVFSPDGRALAAACLGHTVHVWEVVTGRPRRVLKHGGNVTTVVFSPDGRVLASGNNGRNRSLSRDGRSLDTGNANREKVCLWELATGKELHRFAGHQGGVTMLAFSPGGQFLASASSDTTTLLWDVAGSAAGARPQVVTLAARELEALWAGLAGADAAQAYRSMCTLAASRQTVAFLSERLPPVTAADSRLTARLLTDLGSDRFAVRRQAMRELEKLAASAEPALRQALTEQVSLEVRRRIEQLLRNWESGSTLRSVRTLEILESLGTLAAQRLLERLANGAPRAQLTREARASLERLVKRRGRGNPSGKASEGR